MKRNIPLSWLFCLAVVIASGAAAHADSFTFVVEGAFLSGGGTLTAVADPSRPNVFDVTGISGTVDGGAVTGLLPCATYDPAHPCSSSGNSFFYDNLLYLSGIPTGVHQVLDYEGIGFVLGNDGVEGDFAAANLHQYVFLTNTQHPQNTTIGFTLTPEPASFVLLCTGLLGVGGALYCRLKGEGAPAVR